jgi:threonyl-tRNA synthetase
MLIVGEKEAEANAVGVRKQSEGDLGAKGINDFIAWFKEQL